MPTLRHGPTDMPPTIRVATARSLRAVCFSVLLFVPTIAVYAAADGMPATGNPSQPTSPLNGAKATTPKLATKPLWSELTPAQQQALAPLAAEWDKVDTLRKKKWLEIGNKFASMKPDEQQRIQERMREWVKLTPEQRRVARESFARSKKLDADQKSAQWQEYQQLPEEQKKKLAADDAAKKRVANLPAAHNKNKSIPSIKSTPKPILEHSVNPNTPSPVSSQPASPPAPPATAPK
jgi:hypothetical protein